MAERLKLTKAQRALLDYFALNDGSKYRPAGFARATLDRLVEGGFLRPESLPLAWFATSSPKPAAKPCAPATEARMRETTGGGTYIGKPKGWKWAETQRVRKIKGSSWQGPIVGFYSTVLTPVGYCVESEREPGAVRNYPESALELMPEDQPHE